MMELITLVERATQGDAAAFGHLVTEHWRFVYTLCLSQVGQAADAEDLTQEVFVQVSQGLADARAGQIPAMAASGSQECVPHVAAPAARHP